MKHQLNYVLGSADGRPRSLTFLEKNSFTDTLQKFGLDLMNLF